MSRSDWSILAALAGLAALLVAFGTGLYLASLNYPHEQRYQQYRYSPEQPAQVAAAAKPNTQHLQYRTPCSQPEGQGESDLCAQWRAANAAQDGAFWTKWGVWIGLIGSTLLLWQIMLTRKAVEDTSKATKAMERQNEIASDTAKRQLRAYCSLLEYEGTGVAFDCEPQFTFTVANTGQTPAKLRADAICWITTVGQINYSTDVWFCEEITVGAGKTIKPIAKLGHKISQAEWDGLLEGTLVLCAGAYGEYTDIFGDTQSFKSVGYAIGLTGQFNLRSAPWGHHST